MAGPQSSHPLRIKSMSPGRRSLKLAMRRSPLPFHLEKRDSGVLRAEGRASGSAQGLAHSIRGVIR